MARQRLSRRAVLKSLGLGLGALPLMHTGTSRGATATGPKRLVIVYQTGGMVGSGFWPQGTGTDLTQLTLPAGTSPLKPHASNLTFIKGLWHRHFIDPFPPYSAPRSGCGPKMNETCLSGDAHSAYGVLFTGKRARLENNPGDPRGFMYSYPTGPSVDQYIGQKLADQGAPLPLVLGVAMSQQPEHITGTRSSWKGEGQPVGPEDDTFKLFDKYLAGRGSADQKPDPTLERIRAEKRSVLDYVGRDLERFGSRVSTAYQEKVQAHLGAVRDLEKIISPPPPSPADVFKRPDRRSSTPPTSRSTTRSSTRSTASSSRRLLATCRVWRWCSSTMARAIRSFSTGSASAAQGKSSQCATTTTSSIVRAPTASTRSRSRTGT